SNPRTCYSQQFSRLPQSTALPFLRRKSITPDELNKNFFFPMMNLAFPAIKNAGAMHRHS
ncbi:hypothetical protein, partial [Chitinophaga sp.]|uniref:hypothetical protein n=1 Tax=Chitinophaga sp. TaxID=1869181 RepID=UPI002624066A